MSFYVFETLYQHARKCKFCEIGMSEGYLHDLSDETFCSTDCAEATYPDMDDLMAEGNLFWTSWYDEVEVLE